MIKLETRHSRNKMFSERLLEKSSTEFQLVKIKVQKAPCGVIIRFRNPVHFCWWNPEASLWNAESKVRKRGTRETGEQGKQGSKGNRGANGIRGTGGTGEQGEQGNKGTRGTREQGNKRNRGTGEQRREQGE